MPVDIGGAGALGVGFETTFGTYAAPTKWIPLRSESLQNMEDKLYRTNIRQTADRSGAVQGYTHVEGDVEFEVTGDILVYFLYAARMTPAKTGASAPFTYTFAPRHTAKPTTAAGPTTPKTLSLHLIRGGNEISYLGCAVGQLAFSLDAGVVICTVSLVGTAQGEPAAGTPVWSTAEPYGPGDVSLEIPTGTPRGDSETFTLTINDNLVTANRLNGSRSAAYEVWGEREVTASVEADFDTMDDYDIFINQTAQALTFVAENAVDDSMTIVLNTAIQDSFASNLSGMGDVVRMTLDYHAIHAASAAYGITVITDEDIT